MLAAVTCTVLAVLSKETGATLPLLCCTWDFFSYSELSLRHLPIVIYLPFGRDDNTDAAAAAENDPTTIRDWNAVNCANSDESCLCDVASAIVGKPKEWSFWGDAGLVDTGHNAGSPQRPPVQTRLRGWTRRAVALALGTSLVVAGRLAVNDDGAGWARALHQSRAACAVAAARFQVQSAAAAIKAAEPPAPVLPALQHVFRYNSNRHALEPFTLIYDGPGGAPRHYPDPSTTVRRRRLDWRCTVNVSQRLGYRCPHRLAATRAFTAGRAARASRGSGCCRRPTPRHCYPASSKAPTGAAPRYAATPK